MAQGGIKLFDSEGIAPLGGAEGLIGQSMLQLIVQRGATPPVAVAAGGKSYVPLCIFPCQSPFLSWGWLVWVRFVWDQGGLQYLFVWPSLAKSREHGASKVRVDSLDSFTVVC